jgi:hypothetical protein
MSSIFAREWSSVKWPIEYAHRQEDFQGKFTEMNESGEKFRRQLDQCFATANRHGGTLMGKSLFSSSANDLTSRRRGKREIHFYSPDPRIAYQWEPYGSDEYPSDKFNRRWGTPVSKGKGRDRGRSG